MFKRRVFTILGLTCFSFIAVPLAPAILLLSYFLSLVKSLRTLPQAMLLLYFYISREWSGLVWLSWIWLFHRHKDDYIDRNRVIQFWWIQGLFDVAVKLYRLDIKILGEEAIQGPTAIVLARHTSVADTVLPLLLFGGTRKEGVRYVLKQELQILPCIDIAGNRLPNAFVDRSGTDSAGAIKQVSDLLIGCDETESMLIYPEGTRSSVKKREQLATKKPNLRNQLDRWYNLLPPRLGGISALAMVNPGKDLVFLAHVGFEGSASILDLINGSWLQQKVLLKFWRIPYEKVPKHDFEHFLFGEWDEMNRAVDELTKQLSTKG